MIGRPRFGLRALAVSTIASLVAIGACGSDDTRGDGSTGEQAGVPCSTPDQCYPDVADVKAIQGTVTCLTKVPGGYCTHICETDGDCCAAPGECKTGHPQVCSPFESTADKYCFLSCEDADVGSLDASLYCHDFANEAFGCRSSGGGSMNRKICSP